MEVADANGDSLVSYAELRALLIKFGAVPLAGEAEEAAAAAEEEEEEASGGTAAPAARRRGESKEAPTSSAPPAQIGVCRNVKPLLQRVQQRRLVERLACDRLAQLRGVPKLQAEREPRGSRDGAERVCARAAVALTLPRPHAAAAGLLEIPRARRAERHRGCRRRHRLRLVAHGRATDPPLLVPPRGAGVARPVQRAAGRRGWRAPRAAAGREGGRGARMARARTRLALINGADARGGGGARDHQARLSHTDITAVTHSHTRGCGMTFRMSRPRRTSGAAYRARDGSRAGLGPVLREGVEDVECRAL